MAAAFSKPNSVTSEVPLELQCDNAEALDLAGTACNLESRLLKLA